MKKGLLTIIMLIFTVNLTGCGISNGKIEDSAGQDEVNVENNIDVDSNSEVYIQREPYAAVF